MARGHEGGLRGGDGVDGLSGGVSGGRLKALLGRVMVGARPSKKTVRADLYRRRAPSIRLCDVGWPKSTSDAYVCDVSHRSLSPSTGKAPDAARHAACHGAVGDQPVLSDERGSVAVVPAINRC